jgi:hypothetical protein
MLNHLFQLILIHTNTLPWYRDLSSWLWIGGAVSLIGIVYCGYKFITDPLFLTECFSPTLG